MSKNNFLVFSVRCLSVTVKQEDCFHIHLLKGETFLCAFLKSECGATSTICDITASVEPIMVYYVNYMYCGNLKHPDHIH